MSRKKDGWANDPLCSWLRQQREGRRWSLTKAEEMTGAKAVVIGSYERGDRTPAPQAVRHLAKVYGFELAMVPVGTTVPPGAANLLRLLADELDQSTVVPHVEVAA